jgi:2-aminoadipate transaminase
VTVDGIDTTELFMESIKKNVAFVVGKAFYGDGRGKESMRLNFSYSKDADIAEGIGRLAGSIKEMRKSK